MERKVPDEEEKKNPTKRNPLRVAITLFFIHTHPLQRRFTDSVRNADSRDYEQFVFRDIVFV